MEDIQLNQEEQKLRALIEHGVDWSDLFARNIRMQTEVLRNSSEHETTMIHLHELGLSGQDDIGFVTMVIVDLLERMKARHIESNIINCETIMITAIVNMVGKVSIVIEGLPGLHYSIYVEPPNIRMVPPIRKEHYGLTVLNIIDMIKIHIFECMEEATATLK